MPRALPAEPKDHQSRIALWRVGPNIGKVHVHCHQCTTFAEANRRDAWIACAGHPLIQDGNCVVAGLNKWPSKNARKILVQLKQHSGTLPGQWHYAFIRQLGSVKQGRLHRLARHGRVVLNDFLTPQPSAKLSRMIVTMTRVPVMQALPWQISGLLDM